MNVHIFLLSIASSSLGVFLDNFSTNIFTRELGPEFEANPRVRRALLQGKQREQNLRDAATIVLASLVDLFFFQWYGFSIGSLGLIYGAARGFTGLRSLNFVAEYRIVGIEERKEYLRKRIKRYRKSSTRYRVQYHLFDLSSATLCLVAAFYAQNIHLRSIPTGWASSRIILLFYSEKNKRSNSQRITNE